MSFAHCLSQSLLYAFFRTIPFCVTADCRTIPHICHSHIASPTDYILVIIHVKLLTHLFLLSTSAPDGRSIYTIRSKNGSCKEVTDGDIIGPGFHSISSFVLKPEQKVYLTYQGNFSDFIL